MPGPLSDLEVLDLTHARAGPAAVRQLADWGARILRIDRPIRVRADEILGARDGSDFQNLHHDKRSLTLDLESTEGRAVFHDLARAADVVVENWRPPVKTRLGVDYETLRSLNPRLIYASVSGFGQDGPYADRGGVDQIAQGLGGIMGLTGTRESGPFRAGVPIVDLTAGLHLAIGILVAVHEREQSGSGQWVQTSLLEAAIGLLDFQATRYTIDGEVPEPAGNDHPTMIPMGCFQTADGHLNVAASSGRLWRRFCEALETTEWLEDPRFATADARAVHRADLDDLITARLVTRTGREWTRRLDAAGVPCGPVNRLDETFADPQVLHLGMVAEVEHPRLGTLGVLRNPVRMDRTPPRIESATPDAGADSEAILAELGYSVERIRALRAAGVV